MTGHQILVRGVSLLLRFCWVLDMSSSAQLFFPCALTDLEVYVLNTEADIQDLTFPHSYDSDSILQISALALQQYSNNGQWHAP